MMLSMVGRTSFMSWRCAPSIVTPILGMQGVSLVFWLGSISAAAAGYSSPP